jgi:hypothetical protein
LADFVDLNIYDDTRGFATNTPSLSLDLGKKIKFFPAEENLSDRIFWKI